MSEGNVFGQPTRSREKALLDDLAKTQPDWSKRGQMNVDDRPVKRVPPRKADEYFEEYDEENDAPAGEVFDKTNPKFGGTEKTQNGPMAGMPDPHLDAKREFHNTVHELAEDRARLVSERQYLINVLHVDPDALEPIDGHEALLAMQKAHPLRFAGPALGDQRVELDADQAKATRRALDQRDAGMTREKINAMSREEIEAVGKPLAEYIYDPRPGTKDSNPKEAFGSRKAGLSTISRPVLYEVGLAMLEGALKYGRHNYRIAGVRASTYFDACGRHMDAWWEGQDIDPDSKAQLHHVTKAIAGLTVIRDSMIMGNWTDDRPPSIADPNWLAWYNEQAAILVDACKQPKAPFVKGDNE